MPKLRPSNPNTDRCIHANLWRKMSCIRGEASMGTWRTWWLYFLRRVWLRCSRVVAVDGVLCVLQEAVHILHIHYGRTIRVSEEGGEGRGGHWYIGTPPLDFVDHASPSHSCSARRCTSSSWLCTLRILPLKIPCRLRNSPPLRLPSAP